MTFRWIVAGLFAAALIPPASAQGTLDDVRCVVLSSEFAKAGKDEAQRRVAAATGGFYLGRLDGRVDAKTLTDAVRNLMGKTISREEASKLMTACAAKLDGAERSLQAAVNSLKPTK